MTPQRRRRRPREPDTSPATELLGQADVSLLDLVDHVLNKGVVLSGEITLGLANIDLIYVRLLALICAADRVSDETPAEPAKRHRR